MPYSEAVSPRGTIPVSGCTQFTPLEFITRCQTTRQPGSVVHIGTELRWILDIPALSSVRDVHPTTVRTGSLNRRLSEDTRLSLYRPGVRISDLLLAFCTFINGKPHSAFPATNRWGVGAVLAELPEYALIARWWDPTQARADPGLVTRDYGHSCGLTLGAVQSMSLDWRLLGMSVAFY